MILLQFTAPAFLSSFVSLSAAAVQPLQIKELAGERPKVIKLDSERKALRRPASAAEVEICPEKCRLLVNRAETLRPSSVDSFLQR